ncbi:MAG: DNA-binding protein [Nitrosopumilus sp.]|nr:DNA-binding protein [Nitrosopumilus sp.]
MKLSGYNRNLKLSANKKSNDAEDILSEFGSRTNPEPVAEPTPEPVAEPTPKIETTEERNVIFIGTKPIMDYVSATLTQLSTRPTITIKARGKRITQAVDVSQMITKRMDAVGFVISDVRISSELLTSQDGKERKVSNMEIDISKE